MQKLKEEFLVSRVRTLLPYEVGTCIVKVVFALVVNISKYRLGVLPSILDDVLLKNTYNILLLGRLYRELPLPLYLCAIVIVLG